ncbi:quinohemoprotein amine dehydrogenase subunit alpha [Novosphingobium mangrovi (ex Huang et al. 2023)]|uniref:Quinohemoprotein amine dehydrogenase subunit alpha n=1 Tax=Novosphingobium mangrovi (ex Huang et al. 2023) TaxID=2976432 RepID=A0ABT2I9H5_9SPHN|nr:quinohemoprotein amine dehydrogenase subunit alpha [Novosphingobium mangrovi (ex Huang et al. 2023)]MCT2401463.1 quinohemoprotein amine dehydrogenase subunit alpha [Novosphingobium mangrovi (ex Huang et al. 2023)]
MTVARRDVDGTQCGSTANEALTPAPLGQRLRSALNMGGRRKLYLAPLLASTIFSASIVVAQVRADAEADLDPADWTEKEVGIPVTDALTIEKCGSCHVPDDKGNLSRISWIRATPEGWSQAIKRMVKLNGLSITPQEARSVVKYLGTWHGLAPEEAKPVMYLTEHRIQDETIIPNETVHTACASCHAFAQPMSSRRSHREWGLLQNMHKALYPQAEVQMGHPAAEQPAGASPSAKPVTTGEVALAWLSKEADLHSKAWTDWRPRIRTPKLAGKWVISGKLRGQGRFVGEMTIAPASDDFATTTTLRSLDTGKTMSRSGKGLVYAGYSWRGTSISGSKPAKPDDLATPLRETMWFSPDQSSAEGRWYWGEYQEFGLDVKMTRATGGPVLAAVSPLGVKTGTKGAQLHIYGADLPSGMAAGDLDIGDGVTVRQVSVLSPGEAVATVDVAPDAIVGLHDVALNGVVLAKALPVYDTVDYMKVSPETALAHLGGIKYGKGYEQFEAMAWSKGPDGKPGTDDDFPIMPVDANWAMKEFPTVTYDNDVKFVGQLDASGFFTPNVEGPNPERRFSRNNYGEVWIVATAKTLKDKEGKPLTGQAYLVTTVPAYKRWDQPEVSQ